MKCHPTKAERVLNNALRKEKKIAKRLCGHSVLLFDRQVLKCGYILDFYFQRSKLAVEVDGSYHNEEVLNSSFEVISEVFREIVNRYISKSGKILSTSTRERARERYSPLFMTIEVSQDKEEYKYQPSVGRSVDQLKGVAQPRPSLPAIFPELWQKDPLAIP